MPKLVSLKMVQISIAITISGLLQSKFTPFLLGLVLVFINKLLKNQLYFWKLERICTYSIICHFHVTFLFSCWKSGCNIIDFEISTNIFRYFAKKIKKNAHERIQFCPPCTGRQHIFGSVIYGIPTYFPHSAYRATTYFRVQFIRGEDLFWSDIFPLTGPVFR